MANMMTDDVVWQVNVPSWKSRKGRETCRAELVRQNAMSTGGLKGSQVLNIASNDRVVFTERVDVFETMGKRVTLHTNAVYEVEDGKIAAGASTTTASLSLDNSGLTRTSWSRTSQPCLPIDPSRSA